MTDSPLLRPLLYSTLALLLFLTVGGYLLHLEREDWFAERRQEARGNLVRYVSTLERQVSRALAAAESMESYIRHHDGHVEDFESHSRDLLRSVGGISAILLAPDGVVRYVQPATGYRELLGQRVVESRYGAAAAHRAMLDGRIALSPPLTLENGRAAVIGHKPIYLSDRTGDVLFWGIVSVVLELRHLLGNAGLDRLGTGGGYRYQLVIDGGAPVAGDPVPFAAGQHVSSRVEVVDGDWELRFAPIQPWTVAPRFYLHLALVLVTASLFAYLVFTLLWQPVVLRRQVESTSAELKRANARYETVFASVREVIFQLDTHGKLRLINPAWERISGRETVDSLGCTFEEFIHPEDQAMFRELLGEALDGRLASRDVELRILGRGNEVIWVEMSLQVIVDPQGGVSGLSGTMHDITERKKTDRVIHYQANYDTLTNLPNRKLFQDRFERAIENVLRKGRRLALMFIDLDRFKWINDSLGHAVGDQLLKDVAMRLTACVRRADTVARFGGDEFIVLLSEINTNVDAEIVARKILVELNRPFELGGRKEVISGSVGITLCPDDGREIATLMNNADKVMYHVKESGRNGFQFFTEAMNRDLQVRHELSTRLRDAIDNDRLQLVYQPIIALDRREPVGVEALLRWNDAGHGPVSPGEAISIAEDTQLIDALSSWILDRSGADFVRLRGIEPRLDYVCVNISTRQFRRRIVTLLEETLDRHGLEPGMFAIDLTESLIAEGREEVWSDIERIRAMGVRIMLDDFGAGVSSLGHLKRLCPDAVKLQGDYLADIVPQTSAAAMIGALIAMAHSLDIQTIGEGVEEADQAEMLKVLGCDFAQGYLYSTPLAIDDLAAQLRRADAFGAAATA